MDSTRSGDTRCSKAAVHGYRAEAGDVLFLAAASDDAAHNSNERNQGGASPCPRY